MLETCQEAPSIRLGSRAPAGKRLDWNVFMARLSGQPVSVPCRLEGTKRLRWWMERIGSALEEQGTMLWLAPELEAAWEDWQPPLPDAALAAEILRGQPFRENLVLLADTGKQRDNGAVDAKTVSVPCRLWQEDFLRLVSVAD
ncbi:MAG: hypothetical protein ACLURV_13335 [Gallintestinimicrobium sp.]